MFVCVCFCRNADPNDEKVQNVRMSSDDRKLLRSLWDNLTSYSTDDSIKKCGCCWVSNGKAFQIQNLNKFIVWIQLNDHSFVKTFELFNQRLAVLSQTCLCLCMHVCVCVCFLSL